MEFKGEMPVSQKPLKQPIGWLTHKSTLRGVLAGNSTPNKIYATKGCWILLKRGTVESQARARKVLLTESYKHINPSSKEL